MIRVALSPLLGRRWTGRAAVKEMNSSGGKGCESEWQGFYLEYQVSATLIPRIGGRAPGPQFGSARFDYERKYVWDFKVHARKPLLLNGRRPKEWVITNDLVAVNKCIAKRGGVGFVVVTGDAVMDSDGKFRAWQLAQCGGLSDYSLRRIARGMKRSRRLKKVFIPRELRIVFLRDSRQVRRALRDGWLTNTFQAGFRNSNGKPRPAKYSIEINGVPAWALL